MVVENVLVDIVGLRSLNIIVTKFDKSYSEERRDKGEGSWRHLYLD